MVTIITLDLNHGINLGPELSISVDLGTITPNVINIDDINSGLFYLTNDNATEITITSIGDCKSKIIIPIGNIPVTTTTTTTSTTSTSTTTTTTTLASTVSFSFAVGVDIPNLKITSILLNGVELTNGNVLSGINQTGFIQPFVNGTLTVKWDGTPDHQIMTYWIDGSMRQFTMHNEDKFTGYTFSIPSCHSFLWVNLVKY